jgi:actin-related protein
MGGAVRGTVNDSKCTTLTIARNSMGADLSGGDGRRDDHQMGYRRDHMEVVSPFGKDGLIEDWDVVEQLWDHTLHKVRLHIAPSLPRGLSLTRPAGAPTRPLTRRIVRAACVSLILREHAAASRAGSSPSSLGR